MRKTILRILAATSLLLLLVAVPSTAAAYTIRDGVDCSAAGAHDSTVCQTTSTADPITGSTGIIHSVTSLIAVIAGALQISVLWSWLA